MNAELLHRVIAAQLSPTKTRAFSETPGSFHVQDLESLLGLPCWTEADRMAIRNTDMASFDAVQTKGVNLLFQNSLPERIWDMPWAPLGLYAWGDTSILDRPTIAIVGTRKAGGYGKAVSYKFAREFAKAGVTVVSGGAFGVDTQAHLGALEEGGATAVVLPCPIDQAYPSSNRGLFARVREEGGCLFSQFPLGYGSWPSNAPARNHVVAALCDALVVIEAPLPSGSLLTSGHAADLGRSVFVVPGPIDFLSFQGSHQLIREGAIFCDHPHQVLEALGVEPGAAGPTVVSSDDRQEVILRTISTEPMLADKIAALSGLPEAEVLSVLTDMELDGLVSRVEGKYAKRL